MVYQNPEVAFVNETTFMMDDEIDSIRHALSYQVHNHFGPVWHTGCRTRLISHGGVVPPTDWALLFIDDADQAGALGYHDLTHAGLPLGKVFARTTQQAGALVSVTASHELLEMLADPTIDRCVQVGTSTFFAIEVGDACEDDSFAYQPYPSTSPPGPLVSDFVTQSWFGGGLPAPYDFKQHVTQPLELLPGGYIGQWTPSTGWTQKLAAGITTPPPIPVGSRRERRMRGKHNWKRSER